MQVFIGLHALILGDYTWLLWEKSGYDLVQWIILSTFVISEKYCFLTELI